MSTLETLLKAAEDNLEFSREIAVKVTLQLRLKTELDKRNIEYDLNKPEKTIVLSSPYDSVTKEDIVEIKNLTR